MTREQDVPSRETWACTLRDRRVMWPMRIENRAKMDRNNTAVPRGGFIYGQAEAFRRHFTAELLPGAVSGDNSVNSG